MMGTTLGWSEDALCSSSSVSRCCLFLLVMAIFFTATFCFVSRWTAMKTSPNEPSPILTKFLYTLVGSSSEHISRSVLCRRSALKPSLRSTKLLDRPDPPLLLRPSAAAPPEGMAEVGVRISGGEAEESSTSTESDDEATDDMEGDDCDWLVAESGRLSLE